ncbi:peptide chain release factor N(5)-glutamine methyltransferase [Sinimarinibacterium sp. CAU 1509]|nr:peptide chain release factor N(5)-glutamine methyltransferase [Sinimarinibacterium sp. CAU 1509]
MSAQQRLQSVSDSPRLDADLLMQHLTGWSRAQQLTRLQETLDPRDHAAFEALVARRLRGEPVAYLIGERGFWSLSLKVTPEVLVPRPETELLVQWALDVVSGVQAPRIADLGTGSGAIALALASERADALVEAVDLSNSALTVARDNAQTLGLQRVRFLSGNWLEPLSQRYHLLVSNPPYIASSDDHLAALRHEPLMALTDGADGLNALREIISGAQDFLVPGGWLLVEHGYDQGAAVRALFAAAGFAEIETQRDYAGHERASGGRCAGVLT